jgi:hypothetical protein
MAGPGATRTDLCEYLEAQSIEYLELEHPGGRSVVVPAWGGRVIFLGAGEQNRLWTSPDFRHNGLWPANYGGMRSWLSPEGGPKGTYFSADWEAWSCPAQMDPGRYHVTAAEPRRAVRLDNAFEVETNDGTALSLTMGRDCSVGERPAAVGGAVGHVGLDFAHRLQNNGGQTLEQAVDLWHLVQVVPGGVIVVPTRGQPGWRNYFEPIPADRYAEHADFLVVRINGAQRYKLGVPNTSATGGIAYLQPLPGGEAAAIVKRFAVEPGAVHCDRPQGKQEENGDVVQLYNHMTGGAEGFGEIECHSPAATLAPGEEQSYAIRIDLVEGPEAEVRRAAGALLERDLSQISLAG